MIMELNHLLDGIKMDKLNILIVEDESIVALEIKRALIYLKYNVVDIAKNYDIAISFINKYKIDVVLMDICLKNSKKDGIDTAIDIQKIKNIPIIYLTAYSDELTLSRAIITDPISYLIKPFKREELKSTIMLAEYKLTKTNKKQLHQNCYNLGLGYCYNLKDEILYFEDLFIRLSKNETKLLNILVEGRGTIVPYSTIEYFIWPDGIVSESTLRTLIYRLRGKLDFKLIETISPIGCKLSLKS